MSQIPILKHKIFSPIQDNFRKLFQLQSRLGEHDLIKPNRVLIKEGDIGKISRNAVVNRYLVLFNDCIIYAKKNATGDLRVSQNIPLTAAKAKVRQSDNN